jgi:hypothetical protein
MKTASHTTFKFSRFAAAAVLFLLLDGLCFRTGFYTRFIEPSSAAGVFKERLIEVRETKKLAKLTTPSKIQHLIAFMGDSRMSSGFSAKEFDELEQNKTGYTALNLAMPGSTPRVWFYLLEQADKNNNAFDAIVLPMPSYDFYGVHPQGDPADRPLDLRILLPMINSAQLIDLANSFHDDSVKERIWISALISAVPFQDDVCDFLMNPAQRLDRLKNRKNYAGVGDYNYQGSESSLSGFVAREHRLVSAPPNAPPGIKFDVESGLARALPAKAKDLDKAYLAFWLNRIVDKYQNSKTKIIFVRIPSDPFRVGQAETPNEVFNTLKRRPNVLMMEPNAFTAFEKPIYFHDLLHLDTKGRNEFSKALATGLLNLISQPQTL